MRMQTAHMLATESLTCAERLHFHERRRALFVLPADHRHRQKRLILLNLATFLRRGSERRSQCL
jgi:hypothetical protein